MTNNNIKLGIFFTGGLIILITSLYFIGSRQNMFESNIEIKTYFTDAMGLQEGSGVQFMGITIGSVEEISIINDTVVTINMKIDKSQSKFIKKDAIAVITSDGLMGNKLVTIQSGSPSSPSIENGDQIQSEKPVGMENVMNSILENSRNLEILTGNLIDISDKVRSGEGLVGKLFYDSIANNKIDLLMNEIDMAAGRINSATKNIDAMTANIADGKGMLGRLIYDTALVSNIVGIIDTLSMASDEVNGAARELNDFAYKLNNGRGSLSRFVNDTTMADNLNETLINAKQRTAELEETIDIINDSWILNIFSGRNKNNNEDFEESIDQ